MDQGLPAPHLQESGDVGHTALQLEGHGDAVERLEPIGLVVLLVLVEIDEAGGDHQAPNVQDPGAIKRLGRDECDAVATEPYIPDRVETCLGIDDPATLQHEVELLGRSGPRRQERHK